MLFFTSSIFLNVVLLPLTKVKSQINQSQQQKCEGKVMKEHWSQNFQLWIRNGKKNYAHKKVDFLVFVTHCWLVDSVCPVYRIFFSFLHKFEFLIGNLRYLFGYLFWGDTWHVTCAMCHNTCFTWKARGVENSLKFQVPSSYGLGET